MKHFFFGLTICIGLYSCIPKKVVGTYLEHNVFSTTKLILDSNNRFKYLMEQHMMGTKTTGNWRQKEKYIFFQSDSNSASTNGRAREKLICGNSYKIIKIFDYDCKTSYPGVDVVINDSINMKSDQFGEIHVDIPVREVYFRFESGYYFHYYVHNPECCELEICLFPNDRSEIFFSNEKYKISGKNLIGKDGIKLKKKD